MKNKKTWILVFSIVLAISFMSIHSNSFWGDEACRLWNPEYTFGEHIGRAIRLGQTGYMLYVGAWGKIFGLSEVAMRCSNIPFALIAAYQVTLILKKIKLPAWFFVFFFVHPMFTYYMNEIAPYLLIYALSLVFIRYVLFSDDEFNDLKNIIKINAIFLVGTFCHFIFGFIYIIYLCKCIFEIADKKLVLSRHLKVLAGFSIVYIPLFVVILRGLLWRIQITGTYGLQNIAFIFYGFAGFGGIGMSRNDLRAYKFENLTMAHVIGIVLLVLVYLAILFLARKKVVGILKNNYKIWFSALGCFAFLNIVSAIARFRVWERHSMIVFPIWILLICFCVNEITVPKKYFISICMLVLMLYSSANLRFNYYYYCDDFKSVQSAIKQYVEAGNIGAIYTGEKDVWGFYDLEEVIDDYGTEIIIIGEDDVATVGRKIKARDEEKVILILGEKFYNENEYNFFDEEASIVNDSYNSYKILVFD